MRRILPLLLLPLTLGSPPVDTSLEAAYIQTGMANGVGKVQDYLVSRYVTPIYLDKLASGYFVYKKREVSLPLGKGDRLGVTPNSLKVSIPF